MVFGPKGPRTASFLTGRLEDCLHSAATHAARDVGPRQIPGVLFHALRQLLEQLEDPALAKAGAPFTALAFFESDTFVAFAHVGGITPLIRIDSQPFDPPWYTVRSTQGLEARAFSVYAGRTLRLGLEWASTAQSDRSSAIVMAEWPGDGSTKPVTDARAAASTTRDPEADAEPIAANDEATAETAPSGEAPWGIPPPAEVNEAELDPMAPVSSVLERMDMWMAFKTSAPAAPSRSPDAVAVTPTAGEIPRQVLEESETISHLARTDEALDDPIAIAPPDAEPIATTIPHAAPEPPHPVELVDPIAAIAPTAEPYVEPAPPVAIERGTMFEMATAAEPYVEPAPPVAIERGTVFEMPAPPLQFEEPAPVAEVFSPMPELVLESAFDAPPVTDAIVETAPVIDESAPAEPPAVFASTAPATSPSEIAQEPAFEEIETIEERHSPAPPPPKKLSAKQRRREERRQRRLEAQASAGTAPLAMEPAIETAIPSPKAATETVHEASMPPVVYEHENVATFETIDSAIDAIMPVSAPASDPTSPSDLDEPFSVQASTPRRTHKRPSWPSAAETEKRGGIKRHVPIVIGVVLLFLVGWLLGRPPGAGTDGRTSRSGLLGALGFAGPGFDCEITSTPDGAWINVDGKDLTRRTPATIRLKPGDHQITLAFPGSATETFTVQGRDGEPQKLEAPLYGSVDVVLEGSTSGEVAIAVDGDDMGYAPSTLNQIAPGTHEIRFTAPGRTPWAQTIEVKPGQTTPVVARPFDAPANGVIMVQASLANDRGSDDLDGVAVFVDGDPAGNTPLKLNLPGGPHSIRATYRGEEAPIQVIDLPGGNQRFARFEFGTGVDRPSLRLISPTGAMPRGRTTPASIEIEGMSARDVQEMWLHVRAQEGVWRRYPMSQLSAPGGVMGTVVFPMALLDADGRAPFYASVLARTGDEYYTEIQNGARLRRPTR
jgi:hypothetical protein